MHLDLWCTWYSVYSAQCHTVTALGSIMLACVYRQTPRLQATECRHDTYPESRHFLLWDWAASAPSAPTTITACKQTGHLYGSAAYTQHESLPRTSETQPVHIHEHTLPACPLFPSCSGQSCLRFSHVGLLCLLLPWCLLTYAISCYEEYLDPAPIQSSVVTTIGSLPDVTVNGNESTHGWGRAVQLSALDHCWRAALRPA